MARMALILLILGLNVRGQDSTVAIRPYDMHGYIKNMQSLRFDSSFRKLYSTNIFHNRINTKWSPSKQLEFHAEFRNRLIWGDEVRMIPNYSGLLRNDNEFMNLQIVWIDQKDYILITNTERLWMQYSRMKWKIRLGRQRVNWGISTIWNPNDLMNTFNFLDFDYEERPGVDALKIDYALNQNSSCEAVYVPESNSNPSISTIKYNLNKSGYDLQFIAARIYNRLSLGTGWAGTIQNAGFRGEVQYYVSNQNERNHLNVAMEGDYVFKKGWYLKAGFLYNSEGTDQSLNASGNINLKLTPLNLMPTKWNCMLLSQKEFTPLLHGTVTVIYAPGTNLLLFLPALQYSMAENMDLDLVWQSIYAGIENQFQSLSHKAFLRMKWNF